MTSPTARSGAKRSSASGPGRGETSQRLPEVVRGRWRPPIFRKRAAVYVDGFNLYHAIDALQRPYLKWLDLQTLIANALPRNEVLKRTVWCTAFKPNGRAKQMRHAAYRNALEARGVVCMLGHFVTHMDGCNACGHRWTSSTEKQGDVNLALSVLNDAHANRFDVAYLVTVDGDHAATARILKQEFPQKRIVTVAPPGRTHNRFISEWADARLSITTPMLEEALLPGLVRGRGQSVIRPSSYDPPEVPRQKRHLVLVSSA